MDTDKDIRALQSEQTSLSEKLNALKRLTRKDRYEVTRCCPCCTSVYIWELKTGKEIKINNDDIDILLNECIQLPSRE
jgi:hypothetical protein